MAIDNTFNFAAAVCFMSSPPHCLFWVWRALGIPARTLVINGGSFCMQVTGRWLAVGWLHYATRLVSEYTSRLISVKENPTNTFLPNLLSLF